MKSFVTYLRVSTSLQGIEGLGIEAQRTAVSSFLKTQGESVVVREMVEVESGKNGDRPVLAEALELCRKGNHTLLVAKLDRLTRDLFFVCQLQKSGTDFVAADNPHATPLMIHLLVAFAQFEREQISSRTKAALRAAKSRGQRLGNPNLSDARLRSSEAKRAQAALFRTRVLPIVDQIKAAGVSSLSGIAKALSARGIATAYGSEKWSAQAVKNLTTLAS